MTQPLVTFLAPGDDDLVLRFEWHGGVYIDVSRLGCSPSEVINVWTAEGEPKIPFTMEALQAKILEWVEGYGLDNLLHDVKENW